MERCGIEYEGDDKHAQILIDEWNMKGCKAVATPGTDPRQQPACTPAAAEWP